MKISRFLGGVASSLTTGVFGFVGGIFRGLKNGIMEWGRVWFASIVDNSRDGVKGFLYGLVVGCFSGLFSGIGELLTDPFAEAASGFKYGWQNYKNWYDFVACPGNFLYKQHLLSPPPITPPVDIPPRKGSSNNNNDNNAPLSKPSEVTVHNEGTKKIQIDNIEKAYQEVFPRNDWYQKNPPKVKEDGALLLKFESENDVVRFFKQQARSKENRTMLIVDEKTKNVMGYIKEGNLYHHNGELVTNKPLSGDGSVPKDAFLKRLASKNSSQSSVPPKSSQPSSQPSSQSSSQLPQSSQSPQSSPPLTPLKSSQSPQSSQSSQPSQSSQSSLTQLPNSGLDEQNQKSNFNPT